MRTILFFLFICSLLSAAPSLSWVTDFNQAQKEAEASHKPMLLYFTGSDWCSECNKFKINILENYDFAQEIKDKFIFVIVDFPLNHTLASGQAQSNKALKERFKIVGLPTLVLLLPSGNAISMAAPSSIPPKRLATILLSETEATKTLELVMTSFNPDRYTSTQLAALYERARLVAREDWQKQILDAGLKRASTSSFFLRERYRQLIQKGQKDSPEALKLRQALLDSDPDNELGHQLYVAVSDFEEEVKENLGKKDASLPLVNFLKRYNKPENSWRVKAMLASYFISKQRYNEAKRYIREAMSEAPKDQQETLNILLTKLSS